MTLDRFQMKKYIFLITAALVSSSLHAKDEPSRFVQKLKISNDTTAVVAEGDFEARSVGSFSIRLYSSKNAVPGDNTTFFTGGAIHQRDGGVQNLVLADIDRDGVAEIVVVVRNAGSGSYLSAHAFTVAGGSPALLASVVDLSPDSDPVAALQRVKNPDL